MSKQLWADLYLLLYALIMGITSLVLKIAAQEQEILSFITLRFCFAFLVCLAVFFNQCRKTFNLTVLKHSAAVGVVTFGAHVCCTTGVSMTPVSVAGFLTSLQTIAIPLIAFVFLGRKLDRRTLLCVVGASISIALITLGSKIEYGAGVWFCIASSVLAGIQILLVERYVGVGDNAISLTVWQLGVMAVCAALSALCTTGIHPPNSGSGWLCILWTAVVSTAFATYIQTWAQRYTSSIHTGIIFSSVPVFSLIGSRLIFRESFSARAWLGAVIMVACVVCMELRPKAGDARR